MKDTKTKGELHFVIYREPETKEYVGLCLELGLLEVSENPDYLRQSLIDAARGYVLTVAQEEMSDDLLNTRPSKEHQELYETALRALRLKREERNYTLRDVLVFSRPMMEAGLR